MTYAELIARKERPADVPCGSCSACCRRDVIELRPERGDDLARYRHHFEAGRPVLDRKASGECVYLGTSGCTIHEAAPDICRRFDCRVLFLTTPKMRRRIRVQQNASMADVYYAGKLRAATLEP